MGRKIEFLRNDMKKETFTATKHRVWLPANTESTLYLNYLSF